MARKNYYSNKQIIRQILLNRDGDRCAYCSSSNQDLTLDHIVPVSKNGSRCGRYNLVLSCPSCNNKKDDLEVQSFLDRYNLRTSNQTVLNQIRRIQKAKRVGKEVKEIFDEERRSKRNRKRAQTI